MTRNIWRRTAIANASGGVEVAQDDWTLLRPSGEPLARLYKVTGGPQSGRWYWTVLFRPERWQRRDRICREWTRRPRSLRGSDTGNDAGLRRRERASIGGATVAPFLIRPDFGNGIFAGFNLFFCWRAGATFSRESFYCR
jgi:hypothetical protein